MNLFKRVRKRKATEKHDEPEIPDVINGKRIYGKTRERLAYVAKGYDIKDAIRLTKEGKEPTKQEVQRLKELVKNYSLVDPEIRQLSYNASKRFLQGKPVGKVMPRASDIVSIIKMSEDRADPITRNVHVDHHHTFHPVDLKKYRVRNRLETDAIDVDFNEITSQSEQDEEEII